MNRRIVSGLLKPVIGLVLASVSFGAMAADELILYVFKDNNAGSGLEVVLDGGQRKTVGPDGSVKFDLSAGGHSVQILQGETTQASFRFNSAAAQYADITVSLAFGTDPVINVDTYFKNETPAERAKAAKGTLIGRVTSNGAPVAGAKVTLLDGVITETTTDSQGNYRAVTPRGVYDVTVEHPEFNIQRANDIRVVGNIELGANFDVSTTSTGQAAAAASVAAGAATIEEVTTVARYRPTELVETERFSANVLDTLGIGELARFGDSEVSASVVRIPSVTVKDNRFVFIRGLGGRYITTTLNGATLPSTDPAKRTVPLDIFPSNIVQQLDVNKTFTPNLPGESTGGNLVINTRQYPAELEGSLSFNTGYTTDLTGEDVAHSPDDGDWDYFGFEDGSRNGDARLGAISEALNFTDFYGPTVERELLRTGGLFQLDGWDFEETTASPLVSASGNIGNAFDLDNGAEWGFFAAANYKNKWKQRIDGIERTYSGLNGADIADDFEFEEFKEQVDLNGLVSLGYTVGNNTFASNSLASRVTEDRVKIKEGRDGDELLPSYRYVIEYVERTFLSQQFTGNHILGEAEDWTVDWQGTVSRADREAPDRREVRFDDEGEDGVFNLEVPNLLRRWDDLEDYNYDFSGDVEWNINDSNTLSFGAQTIFRDRESDSVSYGFTGGATLDDSAPNRQVNDVITIDSITGTPSDGYIFDDKTLASDSYTASLELLAAYGAYDWLIDEKYQILFGARYEDFEQKTRTNSLQGSQKKVTSVLDEGELLPSFGTNWFITDDQQLRFAVSKTVSRPDFKETSNATFYDPDFDVRIRGNPNLEIATAVNFDLRYEWYWDDSQSVSLAGFYKDLDDPIERVVLTASGTASNSRTFANAESGEVYGVELDGRKDFPLGESLSQSVFVYGNASWIESEVELANGDTPELQGQPEYTLNFVLGYDDLERGQELTLLLNTAGDTITDRGVSGQPDIVLEPRIDLDLNYRWYINDEWTFNFKTKNLLDDEVEFTQGGQTYQEFKTGIEFEVGFTWNIF